MTWDEQRREGEPSGHREELGAELSGSAFETSKSRAESNGAVGPRVPESIDEARHDDDHGGPAMVSGSSTGTGEDDDDIAAIYAKYNEDMLRFFRPKVASNSTVEAEDLAAEVFRRLLEKRTNGPFLDKHGQRFKNVRALLFGIAHHVLCEHFRQVTKTSKIADIARWSIADMSRNMSSLLSGARKMNGVHEGMRELPFYQHLVLDLVVYHHMSYQEVASLLGIPLGSVCTLHRCARRNLTAWMAARHKQPLSETDPSQRKDLRAAYSWYDSSTGSIDHPTLVACVTRSPSATQGKLPEWFVKLQIPRVLPGATPEELWRLVRAVWEVWAEAGRPC